MNKKRKCEIDADAEKNLYQQFQHCANSVTSLFQMAHAQRAQGQLEGQLKLLDRIQYWVMQQEGQALNSDVLMSFLQMEMQMVEQQLKNQMAKQQAASVVHVQNIFPLVGGGGHMNTSSRSRTSTREGSGHDARKVGMDFEEDNQLHSNISNSLSITQNNNLNNSSNQGNRNR
eukprot:TRINITY_DN54337_c0_g1_i1.p1 TRINITY_DN54337_c0_g1~~TRINITY_DN54337_c0_g1_i1.p1  ORF type:complete len:173 (-),score=17.34 TRINITY_DN54337_c0_g1_i1:451-969(-)